MPSALVMLFDLYPVFLQLTKTSSLCCMTNSNTTFPLGTLPVAVMFTWRREWVQRCIGKEGKTKSDFKRSYV